MSGAGAGHGPGTRGESPGTQGHGSGVVNPRRFLAAIVKSRVMGAEELNLALLKVPPECREDSRKLSDHLVEHGVLTRFQAGKLLMGVAKGLRLGRYLLLSPIARGGMATVYLARDTHPSGGLVAVKVLPPVKSQEPRHLARFLRECHLLHEAARHPNLCGYVSQGEDSGIQFLAMDYIPGHSLFRKVMESGPLSPALAARLGAEVARALCVLHQGGIVHRDIKPGNILVSPSGRAVVIDLGLAYKDGDTDWPVEVIGGPGYIVGSMDFIAPEQTVDSSCVDGRADLYALGCTLFFALAGKPPYPTGGTSKERMAAHRSLPVPSVRDFVPGISDRFNQLIRSLMEKDPEKRFQSAGVLAADLELLSANPGGLFPDPADAEGIQAVLEGLRVHRPGERTEVEELVLGEDLEEDSDLVPAEFAPSAWVEVVPGPGIPAEPPPLGESGLAEQGKDPGWEGWALGGLVAVCLFLVVAIVLMLAGIV